MIDRFRCVLALALAAVVLVACDLDEGNVIQMVDIPGLEELNCEKITLAAAFEDPRPSLDRTICGHGILEFEHREGISIFPLPEEISEPAQEGILLVESRLSDEDFGRLDDLADGLTVLFFGKLKIDEECFYQDQEPEGEVWECFPRRAIYLTDAKLFVQTN